MARTYRSDYHRTASRLSQRAALLLRVVDQATTYDDNGTLTRFYTPHPNDEWIRLGRAISSSIPVHVGGSGDASAFKGLASAGLIARPRTGLDNPYTYAITEAGRIVVEELYADAEELKP